MTDHKKLLTESQVADLLSVKQRTLARWRQLGIGPKYAKIGGSIRYEPHEIEAYLDKMRHTGTSARAC